MKILTIIGTRPEAIKMVPVIKALEADSKFISQTLVTGQHHEMLKQVLELFETSYDDTYEIAPAARDLSQLTAALLKKLTQALEAIKPDFVLVHGDTTTALAGALAAFYQQIPIGHVEAGLRTHNPNLPFPEEMNRVLIDQMASLHFAPTEQASKNLRAENIAPASILLTGNTIIDMIQYTLTLESKRFNSLPTEQRYFLFTMHRRENWGQPMRAVFATLATILKENPSLKMIYPVHQNPAIQQLAEDYFTKLENVHMTGPLDVVTFHQLLAKAAFVVTDSGGIQEEAVYFQTPVFVLRTETERAEGVSAGFLNMIGTDPESVKAAILETIANPDTQRVSENRPNPFGNGTASKQILEALLHYQN